MSPQRKASTGPSVICLLYTSPEDPEKEITLASYEYDADGNMTLQRNAAGDVMTYERCV